jgi:hypothetical protein
MVKTLKPDYRMLLGLSAIMAVALLVGLSGQASARGMGEQGSMLGQSFVTSRGPAFVTGNLGSITTGGLPQTVATPR